MSVVVLSGGESAEHEVSLASGADVARVLADIGHEIVEVRIDRAGRWFLPGDIEGCQAQSALSRLDPEDVIFPVLHGGWGENGGLQSALEERRLRYVGSDSASSACGMSKLATARAAARHGVQTIPVRVMRRSEYFADPSLIASALGRVADWPLIVKPDGGGSSVGVSVVRDACALRAALDAAFTLDALVLMQPLVTGAEVSIGVWSDRHGRVRATGASLLHLPEGEDAFGYDHKYEGAGGWLEIPASFPPAVLDELRRHALTVAAAVGVRDLARIDFFVTPTGIVLNELNTMPGLREASHFPRLVAAAGTPYSRLLDDLIALASARPVPG